MAFVYILQSDKNGSYYIGSTVDVIRRMQRHDQGQVFSTKRYGPWKLVLQQEFQSVGLARKMELKLKKLKRKDYIEKVVKGGVIF